MSSIRLWVLEQLQEHQGISYSSNNLGYISSMKLLTRNMGAIEALENLEIWFFGPSYSEFYADCEYDLSFYIWGPLEAQEKFTNFEIVFLPRLLEYL